MKKTNRIETVQPGTEDHHTVSAMAALLERALWMNFPCEGRHLEAALTACAMIGGSAVGRRLALKGDDVLDEEQVAAAFDAMKKNAIEGAKIGWNAALEGMALTARAEGKVQ